MVKPLADDAEREVTLQHRPARGEDIHPHPCRFTGNRAQEGGLPQPGWGLDDPHLTSPSRELRQPEACQSQLALALEQPRALSLEDFHPRSPQSKIWR